MVYRFTSRSITPGDSRWINYFFAGIANSGDVRVGVDRGDGITGILATGDYPVASDVRDGVVYASNELTGTIVLPLVGDVRFSIEYGSTDGNAESTGVLYIPAISNVRDGIFYGSGQTEFEGNVTLPGVGDVRNLIQYGAAGTEFKGTFICSTAVAGDPDLITSAFKQLYITAINVLLEDDALTVPCTLIYGNTKFIPCSNCYPLPNKRSSGIYKPGGPIEFKQGVCPFCHGKYLIPQTSEEEVYLAVIEDSKSWIKWSKDTISPHAPDSVVQTISKFEETYTKLKKAKQVVMDTNIESKARSRYERLGEPEKVGLGASTYVIAMWKKIG